MTKSLNSSLLSALALLAAGFMAACSPLQDPTAEKASGQNGSLQPKPIYYHHPRWSPDGGRIAFYSNRDGNFEIYAVRPDGSDLRRLTDNDSDDTEFCWSPDGDRIVFSSNRGGRPGLYLMNSDGANPVRLLAGRASAPSFSPDGARIAYEGRFEDNRDIFVMDADGSNSTRLTSHEANDFRPAWSPEGSRIAFNSKREGSYDLFLMDADGSNLIRLTEEETHEASPTWSPDGTKLLYEKIGAAPEEPLGLHLLDLAERTQSQVTTGAEREAGWSPDGSKIVFVTDNPEGAGLCLYTMDADGSNRTRLMPPP